MTRKEAVAYLLQKRPGDYHPPADRMRRLMEELGNPQDGLRFAHIAGTNGKGSVSCLLASVLQQAGYRTGLYTSPHLVDCSERIRVNGEPIAEKALCAYAERVRAAEKTLSLPLAAFDRITAVAFLHFAAEKCEFVSLEVGLGGLLDATNVIRESAVSILTNIGLDHTAVLGGTVEEIARQKAGIIKKHCPVVLYEAQESVCRVVEEVCREQDAPLTVTDFSRLVPIRQSLTEQIFSYREYHALKLSLAGEYQLHNAAAALEAVDVLRSRGFKIDESAVREGFAAAKWPGRFELLRSEPPFLVDGGHNPQCAEALVVSLRAAFGEQKVIFLLGMLADKDVGTVLDLLAPHCKCAVTVTVHDPRAMPSQTLAALLRERGAEALEAADFADAVSLCDHLCEGAPIVAFGSLYSVGAIRSLFPRPCP